VRTRVPFSADATALLAAPASSDLQYAMLVSKSWGIIPMVGACLPGERNDRR